MKNTVTKIDSNLPPGVLESDRKWPTKGRSVADLTFYKAGRYGWCVQTLSINNRGRTYAIQVDSPNDIVTCGGRPDDVTVHVYVSEARQKALQKFIDLKAKGLESAGNIRDRIGSRRAQGQEMRAQGLTSWRWNR